MDKYTKAVLTVIVCLFSLCGCMSVAEMEEARQQDISLYQSGYKNLELIELCLVFDEQDAVLKYADYGKSRAKLRLIAISRELERRKLDPLLCRKQSK